MKRSVEGDDRKKFALLPECVDNYIGQDNPVGIVDVFVDELDLTTLGFNGTTPAVTGRPSYHPGVMLKIYVYGYLNRVPSSRRIERKCQRNIELMWLRDVWRRTSRRSPTSAATTARPFLVKKMRQFYLCQIKARRTPAVPSRIVGFARKQDDIEQISESTHHKGGRRGPVVCVSSRIT
jgi:hypothetical protein